MFEINFYRDRNGSDPVREYLDALAARHDKDSRLNRDSMKLLSLYGARVGEPYVKHIGGALWELRPLRDRIFFFSWDGRWFILLHCFMKKSQKTPRREIEQATRRMDDFIERNRDSDE